MKRCQHYMQYKQIPIDVLRKRQLNLSNMKQQMHSKTDTLTDVGMQMQHRMKYTPIIAQFAIADG